MKLNYYIDSKKRSTKINNNDIEFSKSVEGNRHIVKVKVLKDLTLGNAVIDVKFDVNYYDVYFLNGYQSWTDSFENKLVKRERNIYKSPHIISHLYAMDKYGDATFYKYKMNKLHGYDIFYSKGRSESFIYNLNHQNAYLIIELIKGVGKGKLKLISETKGLALKAGMEVVIFDYCFYNNYAEGLKSFNEAFPKKDIEKIFGFTSWYNYYQNINEKIILEDLDALDNRFNLFQIDDGYETKVGDWLTIDPIKFPNGLKPIVDKVHAKGLKAGIWLAPYAGEEESELFKNHKELFVKDKKGNYLKAGGNWSGFYALDYSNPDARAYIKKSLEYYLDMGFDFFKLDFLYASHIIPKNGMTRAQYANECYHFLREILGDKIILGCGANVISSYNNFDYLRVGPDVSLIFDDVWFMKMFHRERISTKVTLQNTIYRSLFNDRFFGNDPDVFLLRDNNISLSKEQRHALITINALFGNVLMTSDNIANYDEEKKKELDYALNLYNNATNKEFKKLGGTIEVKYELNGKSYKFVYDTRRGVING